MLCKPIVLNEKQVIIPRTKGSTVLLVGYNPEETVFISTSFSCQIVLNLE